MPWFALPTVAHALSPTPDWSILPTPGPTGPAVSLAAGDVTGDGRADLVWADLLAARLQLAASDAGTIFAPATDVDLGGEEPLGSLLVEDVDGDGTADLAARTRAPDLGVSIWRGAAGPPAHHLADGYPVTSLGDVDGDGVPDLGIGMVPWFGGDPPSAGPVLPGSQTYADGPFALGDLDGDGRTEVLVPEHTVSGWYSEVSGPASLAEWDGAAWQTGWSIDLGDATAQLAVLADVDGDGIDELVTANVKFSDESMTGTLTALSDLGNPLGPTVLTTTDLGTVDAGRGVWLGTLGDTDGDGADEVLFASYGEVRALPWDPIGGFSRTGGRAWGDPASEIQALTTADFDGDGSLDLAGAFAHGENGEIAVWLSAAPATTTPTPTDGTDTGTPPAPTDTSDTGTPDSPADTGASPEAGCGCASAGGGAALLWLAPVAWVTSARQTPTARRGRRERTTATPSC